MTEIEKDDMLIPYTMSAMFAVSGKSVKRYPKKFYENVRRWLIYEDQTGQDQVQKAPLGNGVDTCNYLRQGGKRGYLLERLWQFMFTGHQKASCVRRHGTMSRMTAVSIYRFGVSMPRLEPLGRVFYDLPGAVSETNLCTLYTS